MTSGVPSPTCAGTVHTLSADDNCRSVSLDQGISTNQLLIDNNLPAWCRKFPKKGELCIPDKSTCKPYQLSPNGDDTCASIASKFHVSWTQIITWNIDLGKYCENLSKLSSEGFVLCVSKPGGDWVNPHPVEPTPEPTPTKYDGSTCPNDNLKLEN